MPETRLKPAVGYVRMSTSKQEDSPARQRAEIERLAEREGYRIDRWYEDLGKTGTESANRPQFQELLRDAPQRRFGAVLLYEHSRFSREDVFDAMEHWRTLRDANIKLVSCQRGELRFDDLAGLITAIVGQHEARGESIRLAQRSLSGRQQKARAGVHTSRPAFGFDREIFDESGSVVRRVPWFVSFRKPKSWSARLVPSSEPGVIDAVRFAFDAILGGGSLRSIALELNRRGFRCRFGGTWTAYKVRTMVTNPVYAGVLRLGDRAAGKFARCEDVIVVSDAHPGFIDWGTFQRVQSIIDGAYRGAAKCEPGAHLLTGLVFCHHCGGRMTAATARGERYRDGVHRSYNCASSADGIQECSEHPGIDAIGLESLVISQFAELVLTDENREALLAAAGRLQALEEAPSYEAEQLAELDRKIQRGTENLALAEGDNFASIARLLDDWRGQRRKLQDQVTAQARKRGVSAETLAAFANMATVRQNLHLANRIDLSSTLFAFVERVTVGRETLTKGGCLLRRAFGTIRFHSHCLEEVGEIPFNDWDAYPQRGYLPLAEYVHEANRPVPLTELRTALGVSQETARRHAYRAEMAGLIELHTPLRGRCEAVAKKGTVWR